MLEALMMEAVRASETSVNSYHSTRRYKPEDSHLRTYIPWIVTIQTDLFTKYFWYSQAKGFCHCNRFRCQVGSESCSRREQFHPSYLHFAVSATKGVAQGWYFWDSLGKRNLPFFLSSEFNFFGIYWIPNSTVFKFEQRTIFQSTDYTTLNASNLLRWQKQLYHVSLVLMSVILVQRTILHSLYRTI
jgi:hypothetical protein